MTNTIPTMTESQVLTNTMIKQLDDNVIWSNFANREFQGKMSYGNTVKVTEFPIIRGGRSTLAERTNVIPGTTFTSSLKDMSVEQMIQDRVELSVEESSLDAINTKEAIVSEFGRAIAQAHDRHVATVAISNAAASNQLGKADVYAPTAGTVYGKYGEIAAKFGENNIEGRIAIMVSYDHYYNDIKGSDILDGVNDGLLMRLQDKLTTTGGRAPNLANGALKGMINGMFVYCTNNTPFRQKLTLDTNPTADDTIVLSVKNEETDTTDAITWTYKASASGVAEITIGANATETQVNTRNAYAGTGTGFVDVSAANRKVLDTMEIRLEAFVANVSYVFGAQSKAIDLAETFTAVTNIFGTKAEVITALDPVAINFVESISRFGIEKADNGFYDNIMYKNLYQAAVLGRNNKRIVTLDIAR